jgi:hypothetical protein
MELSAQDLHQMKLAADSPERVVVFCPHHPEYTSTVWGPPPTRGCKDCLRAFYFGMYAKLPPHQRSEWVDKFVETARKLVELESKGRLTADFEKLLPHMRVEDTQ